MRRFFGVDKIILLYVYRAASLTGFTIIDYTCILDGKKIFLGIIKAYSSASNHLLQRFYTAGII